ncbi:MAG: response regulator [Lachnospiraceae bacterium]|nr:response regulator [Lachnospiraceae bacterium]
MYKVMLVDDEPLILRGMSVVIDWEDRGFEIVKSAANGREAYDFLKDNEVDLIIADIKMPEMNGLELIRRIREEGVSDAYYVILSGYNDFEYARQAIRYSCMDYLLKPIDSDRLIEILDQVTESIHEKMKLVKDRETIEDAYFKQSMIALMCGRYDEDDEAYVKKELGIGKEKCRFLIASVDNTASLEDMDDEEIKEIRDALSLAAEEYIGDPSCIVRDAFDYLEDHEIGIVIREGLISASRMTEHEYLDGLCDVLNKDIDAGVVLLAGKNVDDISRLSRSYSNACVLRPFRGFSNEKRIYYYEEEVSAPHNNVVLLKQSLDELITAIEQNDITRINGSVDTLYIEMERAGLNTDMRSMNLNYLIFQLIHLAVEQDETVDQEEILHYISENAFDATVTRGGRTHLKRFALSYAEYLIQLRRNVSRGLLAEIEREIRNNYAENLTLRELSRKYYVNSSYLGQTFKKKYGQSFKDYLCSVRIDEAAKQLLSTDEKIANIAENVGYRDPDYFLLKFTQVMGISPAKYRKNGGMPT